MQTMQTMRIVIATEYLIIRLRRSASGASGSEVIDCCFIPVTEPSTPEWPLSL